MATDAFGPIVRIEPIGDFKALEVRWRALELASDGGFFLSWVFIGCEAETRFAGALLLSVTQGSQDLALALLGRNGRRALLNETGIAAQDAVFIEHNGLLVRPGHETVAIPALRAVIHRFSVLTLSGVAEPVMRAAQTAGVVRPHIDRLSPCVDLQSLDRPFIETLSANARAQIRRAMRAYTAPPVLSRAESVEEALSWFGDLVGLHQSTWQRRGKAGAFADPEMHVFHKTLIARGVPDGAVDLLRITAGETIVGFLYCFSGGRRVLSYQSGFAYSADAKVKPGLVCHALAAAFYAGRDMIAYDLLGGADRYKLTLAHSGVMLHWATVYQRGSAGALVWSIREKLGSGSFLKKRTKKLLPVPVRARRNARANG